uniref:ATPase cation transporting 13A2 n=1 Tax=Scleropages formosus TaxID=113540 RepID=A0A8C9TPL4_SCLFO
MHDVTVVSVFSVLSEDWTCVDLYRQQGGLSRQVQSARLVSLPNIKACTHIMYMYANVYTYAQARARTGICLHTTIFNSVPLPLNLQCSLFSRRKVYGQNLIDVPVKSYARLLLEEVLNPFYIFQVFSIILWMSDRYYYYAACILFISLISISISLYEIRKQSTTLRNMARLVVTVTVQRDTGEEENVSSEELVPGDCLLIPPEGLMLPCDAALLVGECMVNESMLTGESIPVMKTPLPVGEDTYSPDFHRRHTLFCGTQVIQAKGRRQGSRGGLAVVTRTGFFTAKGSLINSILYPQPISFRFYQDALKFLLILGILALAGTIYSIVVLSMSKTTWVELLVRALDIVTIVVPPALPAAMTTGTIYAQSRLKKSGVFCISPPRINVCGKVSVFCFDKTGTLTEEGLDVWGIMEGSGSGFAELVPDPRLLPPGPLLSALASCHSVALLEGQLLGDPLELKMIESTGWVRVSSGCPGNSFGNVRVLAVMRPPASELQPAGIVGNPPGECEPVAIVQRFPFSSSLQRMSVVTVGLGGSNALVFLKGAPEMVASLCVKDSVPAQFSDTLRHFASEGFRVLALAYKPLNESCVKTIERGTVESSLRFLGLLVMKNQVKPESAGVIGTLKQAHLRTVMVTGDNILTAVNVARTCGMMQSEERVIYVHATPPGNHSQPTLRFHLGESSRAAEQDGLTQVNFSGFLGSSDFSVLAALLWLQVLMRGTVYARMAPEQKTQLVKELQKLNYRVGMCGDGANDCGALRAADVGVSLSEAEASVASPFTSKTNNISCVPLLIREGRCALVTSFSLFKYMALYSLIQFCSVLILYTVSTNLSDLQFLFFDLVLVTSLAIVMGRGGPSSELHPQRPPASLLSLQVFASLLLHCLLLVLIQVFALYIPLNTTVSGAGNLPNLEDTSIFAVSGFQYIIMAVVVTKGYPYRKPLYTNVLFVVVLLALFGVMSWLVLYPGLIMKQLLQLHDIEDMDYKLLLVALAALNFFICYLLEVEYHEHCSTLGCTIQYEECNLQISMYSSIAAITEPLWVQSRLYSLSHPMLPG